MADGKWQENKLVSGQVTTTINLHLLFKTAFALKFGTFGKSKMKREAKPPFFYFIPLSSHILSTCHLPSAICHYLHCYYKRLSSAKLKYFPSGDIMRWSITLMSRYFPASFIFIVKSMSCREAWRFPLG